MRSRARAGTNPGWLLASVSGEGECIDLRIDGGRQPGTVDAPRAAGSLGYITVQLGWSALLASSSSRGQSCSAAMLGRPTSLRLLIALFILLPFKLVARVSLALAAIVFVWQPFELARLYAVVAVSIVSMLARLHRWMEAQRVGEEAEALAPALLQLDRLGRAYNTRLGFEDGAAAQRTVMVATAACSIDDDDRDWYLAQPGSRTEDRPEEDEAAGGTAATTGWLSLDSGVAAQLASLPLPKPVRLVVLRREEAVEREGGGEELPSKGGNQRADQQLPTGRDLPPLGSRAAYVHVQEDHGRCISVSAECKGSPITLEDVLFAARGLMRDTEDTAGTAVASKGFELVGCTHAGVLTLRLPQIDC